MNVDTVLSQLASWPDWVPSATLGLYAFSGAMLLFVASCIAALVWDERHRHRGDNTATSLH